MSDDARAVEAVNAGFYAALETADLDLLEAVWLGPPYAAQVSCVHPGWPALHGRAEVLRSFALILANTPYIQFFLTDVVVRVAGDTAVVTCVEDILTGLEPADGAIGFPGGRVVTTNVFRRTPVGWGLWVHHASPVLGGEGGGDDETDEAVEDEGATGVEGTPPRPDPGAGGRP